MAVERVKSAVEARARAEVDVGLRSYMLSVYNYMGLGVALTGIVAWFIAGSPTMIGILFSSPIATFAAFGVLLLLGYQAPRMILSGNLTLAHAAFWTYAAVWGILITPYLLVYTGASVARAFFAAAATFMLTSLYGYVTKRDLGPLGRFLVMATIGLLIAILINVFFVRSDTIDFVVSIIAVLTYAGLTAWKTQEIKNSYYAGDTALAAKSKAIFGAFMLYGSFIGLFIFIMNLTGVARR